MNRKQLHILYLTAEQWPTFRSDLLVLFGKYLPRYGITSDLVTERDFESKEQKISDWKGGKAILCNVPRNRAGQYLFKFWHQFKVLLAVDRDKYNAIQVRDMSVIALVALVVARIKRIPFYYWLSYPQSEGQIDRAKARGLKGGMRFWFPLLQGNLGKWLLYRIILPRAGHVFVQSRQMQLDIAKYGVAMSNMTPVPMGVDTELAELGDAPLLDDLRLEGKQVLVYLGTLDRVRKIEILFQMLTLIKREIPSIILVLVGDTEDKDHREWLKKQTEKLGVSSNVIWTGWLPTTQAWSYVRNADLGLSPFPRSFLLDSASPTKAVEYMALGVPVVVNDNPDQAQVILESGAGVCVTLAPSTFAEAVLDLMNNPNQREVMSAKGKTYVNDVRNYNKLASNLAGTYKSLIPNDL